MSAPGNSVRARPALASASVARGSGPPTELDFQMLLRSAHLSSIGGEVLEPGVLDGRACHSSSTPDLLESFGFGIWLRAGGCFGCSSPPGLIAPSRAFRTLGRCCHSGGRAFRSSALQGLQDSGPLLPLEGSRTVRFQGGVVRRLPLPFCCRFETPLRGGLTRCINIWP